MTSTIDEETRYKLIRKLEENPEVSQRELAVEMGVSLGKINYCLKALVKTGWVKVGNFARSSNKTRYAYFLTPTGVKEKTSLTVRFLEKRQLQYDELKKEIEILKAEIRK